MYDFSLKINQGECPCYECKTLIPYVLFMFFFQNCKFFFCLLITKARQIQTRHTRVKVKKTTMRKVKLFFEVVSMFDDRWRYTEVRY